MSTAVHRITFSSTTREYIDGVSFSSLILHLEFWCQVFFFTWGFVSTYHIWWSLFAIHCSELKIKMLKVIHQLYDQTKCLCTLNDLHLYHASHSHFFLIYDKYGGSLSWSSCMAVRFFIAANIWMLPTPH